MREEIFYAWGGKARPLPEQLAAALRERGLDVHGQAGPDGMPQLAWAGPHGVTAQLTLNQQGEVTAVTFRLTPLRLAQSPEQVEQERLQWQKIKFELQRLGWEYVDEEYYAA